MMISPRDVVYLTDIAHWRPPMKWTFLLPVFIVLPFASNAQAQKSDSKVKATATADKVSADGKQKVTITLEIEKNWYIYANPLNGTKYAEEAFGDNKTVVTLKSKGKIEPIYP